MDELLNKANKLKSNKDTRWDRIRKRYTNTFDVKTETVKKFIEMDFIDKKQVKFMNGELDINDQLNPMLVMDLRHEMIDRAKSKPYRMPIDRELALERLKSHNSSVEQHYLKNELTKFKSDLQRQRIKSNQIKPPKICLNLTNEKIFQSLENCQNRLKDFYNAPIDALKQSTKLTENSMNLLLKNKNIDLSNNQQQLNELSSKENIKIEEIKDELPPDRCVHFQDSVKLINYSRQSSFCSTSDGVDSVISEIADQVICEIEKDTQIEMEMIGTKFQSLHITTVPDDPKKDIIKEEIIHEKDLQNNNEIIFTINDDLLKIKKLQPESKQLQLTVEFQSNIVDYGDDGELTQTTSASNSTNSISQEQNAIIAELFRPKLKNPKNMLREYFLKWIHYITIEKIERSDCSTNTDRMHKINAFLDQIRKEKHKIRKHGTGVAGAGIHYDQHLNNNHENTVVMSKKYKNKIKVQQDIIDLQKIKLERQERMIMELKLNKITEDTKISKQDIKNELKAMIKTGTVNSRSKAKTLQLVGNLRDEEDEDEFARLQGRRAFLMPKFLENMKERAMERSIKHEQAKQRRLQHDAEKEAAKIALEEAKRAEDEEAKRLRIEALNEKRRQEKQAKIQKERDRLRYMANIKKANEFARLHLLRNVGMNAFKKLLKHKRSNIKKAEHFRKTLLKRKVIRAWFKYYITIWEIKYQKADNLRMKLLKRNSWHLWILYMNGEKSKYLVAIDWYELKLSEKIIHNWLSYTKHEKIIEETKMKQAESHYQWHFKWRILERWQRLPQMLKIEKETELRRQRWRLKIWELLPDYKPNGDNDI